MAKRTLTVTSEFGTFTRKTERTYTHLVVVKGYRAEVREGHRKAEIASQKKEAAKYRRVIAAGFDVADTTQWQRECTQKFLAEGKFQKWVEQADQAVARLEAIGPITTDGNTWGLSDEQLAAQPAWGLAGWCGRLDLAMKVADTQRKTYRQVAIIDVATGATVEVWGRLDAQLVGATYQDGTPLV